MTQTIKQGDKVQIYNIYTGKSKGPYLVVRVTPSGRKLVIHKPEFATGFETFYYQPSTKSYANNYSGIVFTIPETVQVNIEL